MIPNGLGYWLATKRESVTSTAHHPLYIYMLVAPSFHCTPATIASLRTCCPCKSHTNIAIIFTGIKKGKDADDAQETGVVILHGWAVCGPKFLKGSKSMWKHACRPLFSLHTCNYSKFEDMLSLQEPHQHSNHLHRHQKRKRCR